eukprot:GHVN01034071.1.p1 GENE.GHVN01034071.1~~GHVN01034071.1.p1  ORF type:complete len:708 (+),score=163.54 GHVN01034071.1:489-2612(+)
MNGTGPYGSRRGNHSHCHPLNQPFVDFFEDIRRELQRTGNIQLARTYQNRIRTIQRYPLPIEDGVHAMILEGVGPKTAPLFDKVKREKKEEFQIIMSHIHPKYDPSAADDHSSVDLVSSDQPPESTGAVGEVKGGRVVGVTQEKINIHKADTLKRVQNFAKSLARSKDGEQPHSFTEPTVSGTPVRQPPGATGVHCVARGLDNAWSNLSSAADGLSEPVSPRGTAQVKGSVSSGPSRRSGGLYRPKIGTGPWCVMVSLYVRGHMSTHPDGRMAKQQILEGVQILSQHMEAPITPSTSISSSWATTVRTLSSKGVIDTHTVPVGDDQGSETACVEAAGPSGKEKTRRGRPKKSQKEESRHYSLTSLGHQICEKAVGSLDIALTVLSSENRYGGGQIDEDVGMESGGSEKEKVVLSDENNKGLSKVEERVKTVPQDILDLSKPIKPTASIKRERTEKTRSSQLSSSLNKASDALSSEVSIYNVGDDDDDDEVGTGMQSDEFHQFQFNPPTNGAQSPHEPKRISIASTPSPCTKINRGESAGTHQDKIVGTREMFMSSVGETKTQDAHQRMEGDKGDRVDTGDKGEGVGEDGGELVMLLDAREVGGNRSDSQKTSLLDNLKAAGVNVELRTLPVGDVVWVYRSRRLINRSMKQNKKTCGTPLKRSPAVAEGSAEEGHDGMESGDDDEMIISVVVERKTLADLSSSIIDGR